MPAKRAIRAAPPAPHLFAQKAPIVIGWLMRDFGLLASQAAGLLGNIGHECGGFAKLHEIGQPVERGGRGWCMWTGPRRSSFMTWCATHGHLDWKSDEANYGYLCHELVSTERGAISALLKCTDYKSAALAFERNFERAGVVNMASRYQWARWALDAYQAK